MIQKITKHFPGIVSLGLIVALLAAVFAPPVQIAQAAALTNMKATLTTLKQNTKANQEILFRLSSGGNGLAANETIILTYDSDIDVTTGLDFEDIDLSFDVPGDGICETGDTQMTLAAAPVTTTMGVVRTSAQVITFTNGSTTIAAGGDICIQIGTNATEGVTGVEQIKNAVTAASDNLVITGTVGGADPETGTIVITSVDDDTVVTSATVAASLSFDITGDFAIGFGTITNAASRWATDDTNGAASATIAHTITAGTNSTSGYTITVKGATLTSTGTPADTITAMASEATLDTGEVEQFGLRITAAGGSGAVDADYDNTPADTYFYGANATTTDVIATSSGASSTTTYSLYYAANISADTEAHTDYAASLIYVGTGNF